MPTAVGHTSAIACVAVLLTLVAACGTASGDRRSKELAAARRTAQTYLRALQKPTRVGVACSLVSTRGLKDVGWGSRAGCRRALAGVALDPRIRIVSVRPRGPHDVEVGIGSHAVPDGGGSLVLHPYGKRWLIDVT